MFAQKNAERRGKHIRQASLRLSVPSMGAYRFPSALSVFSAVRTFLPNHDLWLFCLRYIKLLPSGLEYGSLGGSHV